jgi:hypothetical protein
MSAADIRQGKERPDIDAVIKGLQHMADVGIVNHKHDTAILREAAELLLEKRMKDQQAPDQEQRDRAILTEELILRGARIRELEARVALYEKRFAMIDDYDQKQSSGLLEEE